MAFRFRWKLAPPLYEIYLQRTFLPDPFHLTLTVEITNNQDTAKYYKVIFSGSGLTTDPYVYEFGKVDSGKEVTKDISLELDLPESDTDYNITIRVEQYADENYTQLEEADERPFIIHIYDILNRDDFIKLYKMFFRKGFKYGKAFSITKKDVGGYGSIEVGLSTDKYASYPVSFRLKCYQAMYSGYMKEVTANLKIHRIDGVSSSVFILFSIASDYNIGGHGSVDMKVKYTDDVLGDIFFIKGPTKLGSFKQFYVSKLSIIEGVLSFYNKVRGEDYTVNTTAWIWVDDILIFLPKASVTNRFKQLRMEFYKDAGLGGFEYLLWRFGAYNEELGLSLINDDTGKVLLLDPYENSYKDNIASPPADYSYTTPVAPFTDILENRGWIVISGYHAYFYNYEDNSWATYTISKSLSPTHLFWKGKQNIIYAVDKSGKIFKVYVDSGYVETLIDTGISSPSAVYCPDNDAVYLINGNGVWKADLSSKTVTQITDQVNLTANWGSYGNGGYINGKVVFFGNNGKLGIIDTANDTYSEEDDTYPDFGNSPAGDPYVLKSVTVVANTPDFIYTSFNAEEKPYFSSKQYIYYFP